MTKVFLHPALNKKANIQISEKIRQASKHSHLVLVKSNKNVTFFPPDFPPTAA
ncbi:hypothetical protein [Glaciecola sp. KUL10]|uniref:hypothetical protein n=1 Tax=Glaciecola sp. (strain KUL10) TaxID=2161813 RepID=UPI000D824948|nr:hypothetical protein [Glaciecola sp. KUL10]GBL02952.1 hypothetical protein KUL10_02250 [Glaciecola sp. KUL10]